MLQKDEKVKSEPLLSVIVPIYNVEPYLKRCLDSIISQTYTNMEIILVDDGSLDNSGAIADDYQKKDSRIVVIHKKNEGLVAARKTGILRASGDYIAYVDSDDWIEKDMYRSLLPLLVDVRADFVTSSEIRDYTNMSMRKRSDIRDGVYEKKELQELKENLIDTDRFFLSKISMHIWDKIYRTDYIRQLQLQVPDEVTICEDGAVTYPAFFGAKKIVVTNDCYYHYCLRADSLMGTRCIEERMALGFLGQHLDEVKRAYKGVVETISDQMTLLQYYCNLFGNVEGIVNYKNSCLFPFGRVDSQDNVLIYGAGKFGCELWKLLQEKGWLKNITWADTKGSNGAKSVEDINLQDYDTIIVAALLYESASSMRDFLAQCGVESNRIFLVKKDLLIQEQEI